MTTEVRVPSLPESVTDATLVAWHRKVGEAVRRDEQLVADPAQARGLHAKILIPNTRYRAGVGTTTQRVGLGLVTLTCVPD